MQEPKLDLVAGPAAPSLIGSRAVRWRRSRLPPQLQRAAQLSPVSIQPSDFCGLVHNIKPVSCIIMKYTYTQ